MIRINLLPFRAARKKENIRRQVTIYGLSVVFALLVMTYYFLQLNGQISSLKKEEREARAGLATYQKTIRKINKLEKQIGEIRKKLDVIKTLEKRKRGPVLLLDQISMAVPKEKLWLKSLVEKGGTLSLTGTAMDNETVALFMTNLEKADLIRAVDLKTVKSRPIHQYKLTVSDFSLQCKTNIHQPKKPAPRRGRRRR